MKKNEITTLSIGDLTEEGLGVGRADGLAVFVKDTVPGDRISACIVKAKKNYAFGRALEILERSPDRTEARCPVSRACGGCQIQEMNYDAQLRFKERKVKNNLSRIGGFLPEAGEVPISPSKGVERGKSSSEASETLGMPESTETMEDMEHQESLTLKAGRIRVLPIRGMEEPWHYRNKAQFPVGTDKSGNPVAGFFAGRTHRIIPAEDCVIGIPENAAIVRALLSYMREEHVSAYDEGTGEGVIRHVMTRCGFQTGQIMVVIVANAESLPGEEGLISRLRALRFGTEKEGRDWRRAGFGTESEPEKGVGIQENAWAPRQIVSVILNTNTERTNVILGRKNRVLFGEEKIEERIGTLRFRISPLSFFQVNPVQTKVLYDTVLTFAALSGKETVWDLYCGIGTISLYLAQQAKKVYGIEVIPEAVEDARKNAEQNGIRHAEFLAGKAEDLFPDLVLKGERADVIVVDPPRKGLESTLIDAILDVKPDRIVYVSCDSATLSRDLALFAEGGFLPEKIQPVDMFPHTVHVESCVLLERVSNRKADS